MTLNRSKPIARRTPLKADPERTRAFTQRARAASGTRRPRAVSPASPQQRLAMVGRACIVCAGSPVDPAHLIPRGMLTDGQDEALAVVALCRSCHRAYDDGRLDLLPFEASFREELVFATYRFGMLATLRRVTNDRWAPVARDEAA